MRLAYLKKCKNNLQNSKKKLLMQEQLQMIFTKDISSEDFINSETSYKVLIHSMQEKKLN